MFTGDDMKKGFTLIELLMIIVVLGVILVIASPILVNLNREATISTYKKSVEGIDRAARVYYDRNYLVEGSLEVNPMFGSGLDVYDELELSGELPDEATVLIDRDGNVSIFAIFNNVGLCKTGDEIEEVFEQSECF